MGNEAPRKSPKPNTPCRGWDVFDAGGGGPVTPPGLTIQMCDGNGDPGCEKCPQFPDDETARQVALSYFHDLLEVERKGLWAQWLADVGTFTPHPEGGE